MYLKSIELSGFKSFANPTKLEFRPGITAIVGPNGCGKSNVADSVRWALGEQSAKSLRSNNMEDCIFNGTDNRKAMAMAEVSLSFAECEKTLGTEYNEIMVTRRVFPTGEGQYFINKTPCRLKDIQRLFMDTGVGTASYSILAQGKIDQVLSAHPEDRRAIFEEASSITKFKSDRDEAIRKLERTESNLLRLSDVIREVKRQIVSLQRQAGKARRFKALRQELQSLDLYATRQKLSLMDSELSALESKLEATGKDITAAAGQTEEMERGNGILRKSLLDTEHEIGSVMQTAAQSQSTLDRARDIIGLNRERIKELETLTGRDGSEIGKAREEIETCRRALKEVETAAGDNGRNLERARSGLESAAAALSGREQELSVLRARMAELRSALVEAESVHAKLQNDLTTEESRSRSDVLRRERLTAEQTQLAHELHGLEERIKRVAAESRQAQESAAAKEQALSELLSRLERINGERKGLEETALKAESDLCAKEAQIGLLSDENGAASDLPRGARLLLKETNPLGLPRDSVAGPLLSRIKVEREYRTALEAALRAWLNAVIVRGEDVALNVLRALESGKGGSAQLLPLSDASGVPPPEKAPEFGDPLINHVTFPGEIAPVVRRLLSNVFLVDSVNSVPGAAPDGAVFVTRTGAVVRSGVSVEFWHEGEAPLNHLRRQEMIAQLRNDASALADRRKAATQSLDTLRSASESLEAEIQAVRSKLEAEKGALFVKKGENQVIAQEAEKTGERLKVVEWELKALDEQSGAADKQTAAIAAEIEALRERRAKAKAELEGKERDADLMEKERSGFAADVMERRIRVSELTQKMEHLEARSAPLSARLSQLEALVADRSGSLASYRSGIEKLSESISAAEEQIESVSKSVAASESKLASLRRNKEKQASELAEMEAVLAKSRNALDAMKREQSAMQVSCAEARMRRQNLTDRAAAEYHVTLQNIAEAAEPQWPEGRPDMDTLESSVAEIRTKLDAMGPVNLVADEEYEELEKRHAFLIQHQEDLVKSKRQLMDMINKINATTAEMFRTTFAAINENFQAMFKKLFGGGGAKLVLINEEDVLECGIEIIARPPGKRLQNISLLSGGERTLTAVALLFALYMFKPSPFCVLDEIDAALDDANIDRFVAVLQEFVKQSQFIIITHSRQTIAAASALYGVTMEEKGVSRVVSMRFKDDTGAAVDREILETSPALAPAEQS